MRSSRKLASRSKLISIWSSLWVRHSILFLLVLCWSSKNCEQEKNEHADISAVFHRVFSISTDNFPTTFISFDGYALNRLFIDGFSFFNIKKIVVRQQHDSPIAFSCINSFFIYWKALCAQKLPSGVIVGLASSGMKTGVVAKRGKCWVPRQAR